MFIQLEAIGFEEVTWFGQRRLRKASSSGDHFLIFTFPPQHFAETAFGYSVLPGTISEDELSTITLTPSGPSRVVFRVTKDEDLELTLKSLLDWSKFELVLPDLDAVAQEYSVGVDQSKAQFTWIEMPWGIELSPLGNYGVGPRVDGELQEQFPSFVWRHSIEANKPGEWAELWHTGIENALHNADPTQFEILSVDGFSPVGNDISKRQYVDAWPPERYPESNNRATPLRNFDRLDLIASLSRRFNYTGEGGQTPIPTAAIDYISPFNPNQQSIAACYMHGRSVGVEQFRLTSRGGTLDLEAKWKPEPSCSLSEWRQVATLGRDQHVKLVDQGFLFPFGIEAELVTLSERAFIRDTNGHFVAVLIKQAFLQVPQPNQLNVNHPETMFPALTVTTKRTPPLDLPPSGDPSEYRTYDYFIPTIEGTPFLFEHVGIDWAGNRHAAKMPMIFVSNRARTANGYIGEPGFDWFPTSANEPVVDNMIPEDGDGLRVVDKLWAKLPYRFVSYGDALVAMAKEIVPGDTNQRIQWVEWVRGQIPPLNPQGVAEHPFQPRSRTAKIRLQGIGEFSGQGSFVLATYRDTRFAGFPILDPEPTAANEIYVANLSPAGIRANDPAAGYVHLLETRELIAETSTPIEDTDAERSERIRATYYGTADASSLVPSSLFLSVKNEIQFGISSSSQSTGGISVPDTHVSTVSRARGPAGDATFNERKWPGYTNIKLRLQATDRVDFAAFSRLTRPHVDHAPFDQCRQQADVDRLSAQARSMMGYPSPVVEEPLRATELAPSLGLGLADLFGKDAQILPGLSFSDIFRNVLLNDESATFTTGALRDALKAEPLEWKFKVVGLDWLLNFVGDGPNQISLADLIAQFAEYNTQLESARLAPIGMEASLDWQTSSFTEEVIGPIKFSPRDDTKFAINAKASVDLGTSGLPTSLSDLKIDPKDAEISSSASLRSFSITVFEAIEIGFSSVTFILSPGGKKEFTTEIDSVGFQGPLEFIKQLTDVLGGLGGDSGIDIDLSFSQVRISQKIGFPPTEGEPLFIGPAQVTNLILAWGVVIPLTGRDVLAVSFAISSREKPLTIFVPPYYGGKAHILLEATTRGVRLLEISMQYGALVPIEWGIAEGEASLMAGVLYAVERTAKTGRVTFRAFVKATANVDVAGIIHFAGLIFIGLSYIKESNVEVIKGEALVRVSIKIGWIRYSYSFTADYVETSGGGNQQTFAASGVRFQRTLPAGQPGDVAIFGTEFDGDRRQAFNRFIEGFRS